MNHVVLPQFNLHRIHLYVTSVQPSLEEFCTALRIEHPNGAEWDWSGDDDRLTKLTLADDSFDDGGGEEPFELQPAAPEPRRRSTRKSVWGQALVSP